MYILKIQRQELLPELQFVEQNYSQSLNKNLKSTALKNLLGNDIVESFRFRTCVEPTLMETQFGATNLVYRSLTTKALFQFTHCLCDFYDIACLY